MLVRHSSQLRVGWHESRVKVGEGQFSNAPPLSKPLYLLSLWWMCAGCNWHQRSDGTGELVGRNGTYSNENSVLRVWIHHRLSACAGYYTSLLKNMTKKKKSLS